MAVFDSAAQSLACAVEMQRAVAARNRRAQQRLGVRIGVSVGDATVEDGDYFGGPVVESARLCAHAAGGQIVVNALVRQLAGSRNGHGFRPLGRLELKGILAPVQAFELRWEPVSDPRMRTRVRRWLAGRSRAPAGAEERIRVLVVDDQPIIRDGLTIMIGQLDGVEVVGTAADGLEALERAASEVPDVVLMDLVMPRMEGTQATREIRSALPQTQVLVLSTHADDQSLLSALHAGARGYLTKNAGAAEIERAIRELVAGRTHLDHTVQERLVESVRERGLS
jgi:CheY-like chemotaxis protein